MHAAQQARPAERHHVHVGASPSPLPPACSTYVAAVHEFIPCDYNTMAVFFTNFIHMMLIQLSKTPTELICVVLTRATSLTPVASLPSLTRVPSPAATTTQPANYSSSCSAA